ncbi:unnamed protein product [Diplocarpon coronariae]|nr:hypothetical protein JHW43_006306 [Diplocarpon mali]
MPGQQSKQDAIDERVSKLPLPDDPPVASDWNSGSSAISVKSGERQEAVPNSEVSGTGISGGPAAQGSGVREAGGADLSSVGRQAKDRLDGLPKDATG